jgi:hypothetical protein
MRFRAHKRRSRRLNLVADLRRWRRLRGSGFLAGLSHDSVSLAGYGQQVALFEAVTQSGHARQGEYDIRLTSRKAMIDRFLPECKFPTRFNPDFFSTFRTTLTGG